MNVVFKPVLTTPDVIRDLCLDANSAKNCICLITWMHTFSPAKMWIAGLSLLKKPFLHLHTQYNREIPWSEFDMNFMNRNQAAHGDREFGFIGSRLRLDRKVVVGHWQDDDVQKEIGVRIRAACAWADWQGAKVARFGDNMRDVAVTEGDKVEAQIRLGYDVYGFGVGDRSRMNKDLLIALANAVVANEKAQRRFRNSVLIRLSKIETILTEVQGAQLAQLWPPGKVSDEQRGKYLQEVEQRIAKASNELGLKMVKYIYGEPEQPQQPGARRGKRPTWSNWEI